MLETEGINTTKLSANQSQSCDIQNQGVGDEIVVASELSDNTLTNGHNHVSYDTMTPHPNPPSPQNMPPQPNHFETPHQLPSIALLDDNAFPQQLTDTHMSDRAKDVESPKDAIARMQDTVIPRNTTCMPSVNLSTTGLAATHSHYDLCNFDNSHDLPNFTEFPLPDNLFLDSPFDILQPWLFQPELGSLAPPISSMISAPVYNGMAQQESRMMEHMPAERPPSQMDAQSCLSTSVPQERFTKIESLWHSRSSRSTRLMPSLWRDLVSQDIENLYTLSPPPASSAPGGHRRASRWGFDDACRARIQTALSSLSLRVSGLPSPQISTNMDNAFSGDGASPFSGDQEINLPSTVTCEVALEVYFVQFHPTLPLIHMPTFSAKGAPFPLLLVMCLIGFSILGTPGAVKLVSQAYPPLLQIVSAELQSSVARRGTPVQQLNILVTALLTLNLTAVTGQRGRVAQAEMLYVNLLSVAQWHGLFSAHEGGSPDLPLDQVTDAEQKWRAWSRVECVKRLVVGLLEIDCWFATYFSTCPVIRSDTLQVIPPSHHTLFHATSAKVWTQLSRDGSNTHLPCITSTFTPVGTGMQMPTFHTLLTSIQLQVYEANYRHLAIGDLPGPQRQLEPWRTFQRDPRSTSLASLLVALPSLSGDVALHKAEANSAMLWHSSCMMLTANMQLFELAAGRGGADLTQPAFDDITKWAKTATARRACIHATHAFKILFHRKISDVVNMQTVTTLFRSALVLAFYTLTAPPNTQEAMEEPLELFDEIDWSRVGNCGLADQSTTPGTTQPATVEHQAARFIREGGAVSITGILHPPGYHSSRRILLHYAELMNTMGKWKTRSFSQILHLLSDDLMDLDNDENEDI